MTVLGDPKLRLASLRRLKLAHWPTPVDELARTRQALGCRTRLFVKRDDVASFAFGGSKIRNLEVLAAEAQAAGSDVLLVSGGVQSNCTRATAAIAAKLGMECVVVVNGREPVRATGNLLLCQLLGARIEFVATREARRTATIAQLELLRSRGKRPFEIPLSAATPSAALAVCQGMLELAEQMAAPEVILVCSSSGATQAGLMLGCALLGFHTRVIGISPDDPAPGISERVAQFLCEMRALIGVEESSLPDMPIEVDDRFVGAGPMERTVDCDRAVEWFARTEGLFLDPIYTSRPAAALLAGIEKGDLTEHQSVLLWHTGGQAILFAQG